MTNFQAFILGLIQGVTEFFPISSSAHLKIAKKFLGISDGEHLLYFDLLCHVGTLIALMIYLRKEIGQTIQEKEKLKSIFLALIPLVPGYFLLKQVRIALSDPAYVGYFLWVTALLLFAAQTLPPMLKNKISSHRTPWKSMLSIGTAQTLALIPGISRSGSTIAMARFFGWDWIESAKFSFLLAIPTILGGEILETLKLVLQSNDSLTNSLNVVPFPCYMIGFGASFGMGLVSVKAVFAIYKKGNVRPFAVYCLAMGLIALAIFHG